MVGVAAILCAEACLHPGLASEWKRWRGLLRTLPIFEQALGTLRRTPSWSRSPSLAAERPQVAKVLRNT